MGIFAKALENTVPPEVNTGPQNLAMGAGALAAAAAVGGNLAASGVTAASEMASNASLGGGGKDKGGQQLG